MTDEHPDDVDDIRQSDRHITKMDDNLRKEIDKMTRLEMARKWRYAPAGDPMFQGHTGVYFEQRFTSLGWFSPAISKAIDHDEDKKAE